MGGDDDGAPPGALGGDEVLHPPRPHRVETGGGLVEEDQLGSVQESARHIEAHPHALAHVRGAQLRVVGEVDGGQQPLRVPDGAAVQAGGVGEVLAQGEAPEGDGRLEGDPDALVDPAPPVGDLAAEHARRAPVPGDQAGQDPLEGGLARAAGPQQADDLAGGDAQADVVQGRAGRAPIGEGKVVDRDRLTHRPRPRSRGRRPGPAPSGRPPAGRRRRRPPGRSRAGRRHCRRRRRSRGRRRSGS